MKKLMMTLAAVMALLPTVAANDRPISKEQLPARALDFLEAHFPNVEISLAKEDRELFEHHYEVVLMNSTKIEFRGDGSWYDIDCCYSDVPRALIPEQMRQAIEARYPEARVRELKRERRGWEATLRNGLELTFNSRMQLVDIDD